MSKLSDLSASSLRRQAGLGHAEAAPLRRIDQRPPEPLAPAHRASVERGLAQAQRGEFATQAEVDAAFRRFGA